MAGLYWNVIEVIWIFQTLFFRLFLDIVESKLWDLKKKKYEYCVIKSAVTGKHSVMLQSKTNHSVKFEKFLEQLLFNCQIRQCAACLLASNLPHLHIITLLCSSFFFDAAANLNVWDNDCYYTYSPETSILMSSRTFKRSRGVVGSPICLFWHSYSRAHIAVIT